MYCKFVEMKTMLVKASIQLSIQNLFLSIIKTIWLNSDLHFFYMNFFLLKDTTPMDKKKSHKVTLKN
jgi:hypothetical protein